MTCVINPNTGRAVKSTSTLGQKILGTTKPKKVRTEKVRTEKAAKAPKAPKAPRKLSQNFMKQMARADKDMVLNPATGRLVSASGAIGRKLRNAMKPPKAPKAPKAPSSGKRGRPVGSKNKPRAPRPAGAKRLGRPAGVRKIII